MFGEVEKLTGDAAATDQPAAAQANHLIKQKASAEASAQAEARPEPEEPKSEIDDSKNHQTAIVQCESISAPQQSIAQTAAEEPKPRRNHGGALPQ